MYEYCEFGFERLEAVTEVMDAVGAVQLVENML
jgi:hypothetical protein